MITLQIPLYISVSINVLLVLFVVYLFRRNRKLKKDKKQLETDLWMLKKLIELLRQGKVHFVEPEQEQPTGNERETPDDKSATSNGSSEDWIDEPTSPNKLISKERGTEFLDYLTKFDDNYQWCNEVNMHAKTVNPDSTDAWLFKLAWSDTQVLLAYESSDIYRATYLIWVEKEQYEFARKGIVNFFSSRSVNKRLNVQNDNYYLTKNIPGVIVSKTKVHQNYDDWTWWIEHYIKAMGNHKGDI